MHQCLTPQQVGAVSSPDNAHVLPDRPQRSHLLPIGADRSCAHARPDRGFPRLPFSSAGKIRTPRKILDPFSPASPSRATCPPSASGSGSETDCFFKSSSLDWLQASGSLWPKLKPGTIPEQVSSQCPVYLYSTSD